MVEQYRSNTSSVGSEAFTIATTDPPGENPKFGRFEDPNKKLIRGSTDDIAAKQESD